MATNKNMMEADPKGQEMLKKMILKKLRDQGDRPDIDGLDDVEIPPQHEELLEGLTKLFKSADKNFLTLEELLEFEDLLEKKGIVGKGGLMKKGGLLEDAGLLNKNELTPEQVKEATKFSLDEHLRPAKEKLEAESSARKKAIAAGKLVKEKSKDGTSGTSGTSSSFRRVSASENRQRVVKEVKAKLKLVKRNNGGKKSEAEEEKKEENGETEKDKKDDSVKGEGEESDKKVAKVTSSLGGSSEKRLVLEVEGIKDGIAKEGGKDFDKSVLDIIEMALKNGTVKFRSHSNIAEESEADLDGADEPVATVADFQSMLYNVENICEHPGPDGEGPPVVTYQLALHCLSRGMREEKTVELWTPPKNCKAIKERIQVEFQIPISFQHDLSFAGKPLEDTATVASIGLKPGAKLTLSYLSEGQLEEVRVAMKWYEYVLTFCRHSHPNIFTGMPVKCSMICNQGIVECLSEKLSHELFVPWDSDITYANRVYFIQQNGIEFLLDIYELLINETWRTTVLTYKLMEPGCINILAALGSSALNQQKIIDLDGHGFVLQSLLRVLIRPRGTPLVDTSGSPGPQRNNNFLLQEVLSAAINFFVNFRECSEIHIDICSKNNCVDQVISIAHCPSFSVQQAQACMCLLACCMHSADTHKWLCRNYTVESIANCVKVHRERGETDSGQITLLHYYAQVTLAHLVMTSIHAMSRKVTEKLVLFMEEFLRSTKPATIQELESAYHPYRGWAPFFPYLKILLSPPLLKPEKVKVSEFESVTINKLINLSIETMLFVIQVKATSDPYKARRQLLEEKILPYALCLSANIPRKLLHGAKSVVTALRSNSSKPVPIPKLSIMSRARLATVHFGLKKVLDRTAEELKLEVSPPPPRSTPARTRERDGFNPFLCIISM